MFSVNKTLLYRFPLLLEAAREQIQVSEQGRESTKDSCFLLKAKIVKHLHHDAQMSSQKRGRRTWLAPDTHDAWHLCCSLQVQRSTAINPRTSCLGGTFKKSSPSSKLFRQRCDSEHEGTRLKSFCFLELNSISVPSFCWAKLTIRLAKERTQMSALQASFPEIRTRTYHRVFRTVHSHEPPGDTW